MNFRKYIVEIGSGIDLHGENETKAAQRAVRDAIGSVSMVGLRQLFNIKSFEELDKALMVDVTLATPNPDKIDREMVLNVLPEGNRRITVVKGGLRFPTPSTSEESLTGGIVVTVAVIVVLVDLDKLQKT